MVKHEMSVFVKIIFVCDWYTCGMEILYDAIMMHLYKLVFLLIVVSDLAQHDACYYL